MPKLESVEIVLVHCNVVNNNYQQTSKALLTFVRNKITPHYTTPFTPHSPRMLKTTNAKLFC